MLWNRWRKEYLPTSTQRKNGLVHDRNFKIGDLVIINESNNFHVRIGLLAEL